MEAAHKYSWIDPDDDGPLQPAVPRPVFEPEFRTFSREIYRETIATQGINIVAYYNNSFELRFLFSSSPFLSNFSISFLSVPFFVSIETRWTE